MRVSQRFLNLHNIRVRAAEHASRDPFRVLDGRQGLADVVERGCGVIVERVRVTQPHLERELITISENAPRHGQFFAHQRLGVCEAL